MSLAVVSIIIMGVAIVLYCIPRIPLWVTSVLVMVAMAMTGCIKYNVAYSGYANAVVFLIAGMMILGQACVTTGLAQKIGYILAKIVGDSEKKTVFMVLTVGGVMSIFLNGSLTAAILMPILDSISLKSNGAVTRKRTYFPLGIVGAVGNALTSFSASSMITCVGILVAAGYREMGVFEPFVITAPAFIAFIAFYMLIGYRLSVKWFDFEEIPLVADGTASSEYDPSKYPVWKQWVTGITLIVVIIALIAGGNFGAWPIIGSAVVVLTGCIDEKTAIKSVSWSTVVTVGATIGFSNGLIATGGGTLIANFLCNVAGPFGSSPFGMMTILMIIASLLSAVLSDNGTVSCTIPITMAIATTNGWDPFPLFIAVASGLKMCQFSTPICCGCVTQTIGTGVRTLDYLKLGSLCSLVMGVVIIGMLAIVY